nr:MAG TPA: hypothetical protein [Caudoviricetes sp.]
MNFSHSYSYHQPYFIIISHYSLFDNLPPFI